MPRPRLLSDTDRQLRGTFERSRDTAVLAQGRSALTQVLPPPDDLDAVTAAEWRAHMPLCIAAGTMSAVNLAAFRGLVEAAALRRRAFRLAQREGPTKVTEAGGTKFNAAWQGFYIADSAYLRWMQAFGLTPKAWAGLPRLPGPEARPRVV
jgi:hypothetical protein